MARLNAVLAPVGLTYPRYEALMLLYYSRRRVRIDAGDFEDGLSRSNAG